MVRATRHVSPSRFTFHASRWLHKHLRLDERAKLDGWALFNTTTVFACKSGQSNAFAPVMLRSSYSFSSTHMYSRLGAGPTARIFSRTNSSLNPIQLKFTKRAGAATLP